MELINYLLKVSVCTMLFFAIYLLVLRRLTFFKTNRFYLLSTLLISFIIPTLNFTIEREVIATEIIYDQTTSLNDETPDVTFQVPSQIAYTPIVEENVDWYSILPYLYFGIVSCLLIIAIWRILQLVKHTRKGIERINGLKIVPKTKGFTNCSFFNYVFIDNENLSEAELQVLLRHEQVHAKQLHSIDKVILIVVKAFLWFNPLVYLYDKALEQAHEYEADEATSRSIGTAQYANLLLRLAIAKSEMPLVHNFVKSPIKDRIKMLFNSKSKHMKKLLYLLALPVGLGLLWGFTVKVVEVSTKINDNENLFTLVLDAGHGGKDAGAKVNGYSEKDLTLVMSNKIKAIAETKGIKVVTTRDEDQNINLKERIKAEGDILISLHVNFEPLANVGNRNGLEMFTPPNEGDVKTVKANYLSRYIFEEVKNIRGINIKEERKAKSLMLLRDSKTPGLVLELGYLTDKNDLKFITNEAKQNELAEGIVKGILAYKQNQSQNKNDNQNYKSKMNSDDMSKYTNNQDTSKSQKQKDLEQKKKYEAFRKSPEFGKKVQEMKEVNGKTLTGVIGDDYEKDKTRIGKGKLFIAAGTTYVLEGFTKGNIINKLAKNDEIVVNVDYSSFNMEVPHLIIAAKTISKQGKLLYTAAPRPEPQKHAFLYEANKARYAWSIIKSIHKKNDGTIEKIVLNDNGFTINLDVEDQKFKTKDFKVGSSVIVKFFGEKLVAKNTYTTDKMIVLYSWPKKYELKNKTLFDRFYYEDGKQKIKGVNVVSANSKTNTQNWNPTLISSTHLRVDSKNEISYVKKGRMEIHGGTLLADELTFDQRNKKVITQKATFTDKAGKVITGDSFTFDYGKGTYDVKEASGNSHPLNKKAGLINLDPIEYTATDSVITNKLTGDVFLYGNVKILSGNQTYWSDRMVYNKGKQTLKVRSNAQVYDKMSKAYANADSLDMNLKTGKGIFYGKVLHKYDR